MASSRPSQLPLYLAHCRESRDTIRSLIYNLQPYDSRFAAYKQEYKTLIILRDRIVDCYEHAQGAPALSSPFAHPASIVHILMSLLPQEFLTIQRTKLSKV